MKFEGLSPTNLDYGIFNDNVGVIIAACLIQEKTQVLLVRSPSVVTHSRALASSLKTGGSLLSTRP